MLQNAGVLYILPCKCASRHSGVPFLDMWTSKSGPRVWCFPHFDLQICFAPQRRAIFEHRNVQNVSGAEVLSTFWRASMLRATAACNFWTAELPKWLRPWGVFYILTYKYASRHSRVAFWNIWTSKMAPRMWCFQHFDLQMCFAPQRHAIFHLSARTATSAPAALARLLFEHQEPRLIEKTQRFATSLTFGAHVELLATDSTRMLIFLLLSLCACWSSCYWLYTHVDLLATDSTHMLIFLLLTWLLCDSAFQLYILSEVRLLNFLRQVCFGFSSANSVFCRLVAVSNLRFAGSDAVGIRSILCGQGGCRQGDGPFTRHRSRAWEAIRFKASTLPLLV